MVLSPFAVFSYDIDKKYRSCTEHENLIKKTQQIMNQIRNESYLNSKEFQTELLKKKIGIDVEQQTSQKLDPNKEVDNKRVLSPNQEDDFAARCLKKEEDNSLFMNNDSKGRRNAKRTEGERLRKACVPFSPDEDRYLREGLENVGKRWTEILRKYPFYSTRNRATLHKRAKGLNLV